MLASFARMIRICPAESVTSARMRRNDACLRLMQKVFETIFKFWSLGRNKRKYDKVLCLDDNASVIWDSKETKLRDH